MNNPAPCSSDALVSEAGAVWHSRSRPVVGIVGAGQLARMTHQAAISLSVDTLVLTSNETDPAVLAGAHRHGGSPSNLEDLRSLANLCDIVTFDHELVDMAHIEKLEAEGHDIRPGAEASRLATDKLHAHQMLSAEIGVPVPAFSMATSAEQIIDFAQVHGWPVVVKSRTRGYDGKGVWVITSASGAYQLVGSLKDRQEPAAHGSGEPMLIVEEYIRFSRELAVLVARRPSGEMASYPVVETRQQEGICQEVIAPAPIHDEVAAQATKIACGIAEAITSVGILAVEMFLSSGGLTVNELALRPHNSGHWTMDGCVTSQFEQHLRAILDWPLGSTAMTAPATAMVNVLGPPDGSDPTENLPSALAVKCARVHLYGKQAIPGRKLGHINSSGETIELALEAARSAAVSLVAT